jgi:hypothetical protein
MVCLKCIPQTGARFARSLRWRVPQGILSQTRPRLPRTPVRGAPFSGTHRFAPVCALRTFPRSPFIGSLGERSALPVRSSHGTASRVLLRRIFRWSCLGAVPLGAGALAPLPFRSAGQTASALLFTVASFRRLPRSKVRIPLPCAPGLSSATLRPALGHYVGRVRACQRPASGIGAVRQKGRCGCPELSHSPAASTQM